MAVEDRLPTLTERERALLLLLARGHTVKSAATLTGDSVNAANEVLRAARRKLGVSSSRQAARLLAAENDHPPFDPPVPVPRKDRDGFSGVAVPSPATHSDGVGKGRLFMVLGMGFFAASALFWIVQPMAAPADQGRAPPPRVVSTTPGDGTTIRSGPFTLSVTYDRAMAPDSFSFATGERHRFPDCAGKPRVSSDRRTFKIDCTARPGAHYVVWFNHGKYMNFKSEAGVAAVPKRLAFRVGK